MDTQRTQLWPFVPHVPTAWGEMRKCWPDGLGYTGHDGEYFYFQEAGSPKPVLVPMNRRARALALSDPETT